jgi:hypothetical protein
MRVAQGRGLVSQPKELTSVEKRPRYSTKGTNSSRDKEIDGESTLSSGIKKET